MAYRNRVARDPAWIYVRYAGLCARCGEPIPQGQRAFYYPNGKKLYCYRDACGPACERDFAACAHDEMVYNA